MTSNESGINPGDRTVVAATPVSAGLQSAISLLEKIQNTKVASFLKDEIAAHPDDAYSILMQFASEQFDAHKYDDALAALRASLIVNPGQYATHHNIAVALAITGREKEAIHEYQRTIELAPGFIPAYMNLAGIYYKHKAYLAAKEVTENVLEQKPDEEFAVKAYCNLYDVFQKLHFSRDECYAQLEKAMEACKGRPKEPLLYLNLASYYELTHDLESCKRTLTAALQHFPDCAQAKYLMAVCCRRKKEYLQAIDLLRQCDPRKFEPREIADIHFEFSKCLHETGDFENAFRHLTRANQIAKSLYGPGPSRALERAKNHNRHISAEWERMTDHSPGEDPVFLIGFPRSGTTLLEQILDGHPQIVTLEEKPVTRELVKQLVRINPANLMTAIETLERDDLQSLRDLYLQTRQKFAPHSEGKIIVDKLPLTIINVPILYRLFPRSRFILAVRHPLDCLLSCYMQNFGPNDAMSNFYDLDDAVELYSNTMGIWRKCRDFLQLDFHESRYEDLVDNLEKESRALLEFLRVPWDERVLNYHTHARNKDFINTPSYSQVTQPVYQGAKYRWRNYSGQLAKSKEKVQTFIEYFAYEPE
jgi:tetratricopeptide (TPR) repeat protein